jgi:NAD(P)-dependent dehydrogenase (short-subunit alcohol dehydrogenase family)
VAFQADVRDYDALSDALDHGVSELGRLDIVSANAGVFGHGQSHELSEAAWQDMIDVNLTGVWHTTKATTRHIIDGGRGGSIVLTSSTAGAKGYANVAHYVAAKHGVVGLMRSLANELAPRSIRVNAVLPTHCNTPMCHNDALYRLFLPDVEQQTTDDFREAALKIFNCWGYGLVTAGAGAAMPEA